jgi:hypothetical protein
MEVEGSLLREGWVYKDTTLSSFCVARVVRLHRDGKFSTYHQDPSDGGKGKSQQQQKTTWYLDRKCDVTPRDAGSIQVVRLHAHGANGPHAPACMEAPSPCT